MYNLAFTATYLLLAGLLVVALVVTAVRGLSLRRPASIGPARVAAVGVGWAAVGWVPRDILERPVPVRPGTGNAADAITTASDEARAFYLQGLNYLHGYVWIEAARSFNQALRLDPNLALAHWGLSRTYSGLDDQATAVKEAQIAQQLATRATAREQRRVALRLQQLEAIADLGNSNLLVAYRQALDRAKVCASDPLCAEHNPRRDSSLHAASFHACSFVSATSCECGNRPLDRAPVIPTLQVTDAAFFAGM